MTRRLQIAFLALLAIAFVGMLGFHFLEGFSLFESLYLTIITLSTVGYGDIYALTWQGRAFTMFLIIFGVGTMFYAGYLLAEMMLEGHLKDMMGKGRMLKMIKNIKNHQIICGCGRIGLMIAKELKAEKVPFVVIENNPEIIEKMQEEGFLFYKGDATNDKSLIEAGIKRAAGIVCVLPTDAENLYVILTAKELNSKVFILSRCEEEASEHRLLQAGADRVMSPYTLGAMRMAMAILRPAMLDFIEITTSRQSLDLRMEELPVCEGASIIGKTLEESEIRLQFGLIIVAVKKASGKMIFNPMANYVIEQGDELIAMGEDENVRRLALVCLG
ncbi:MAG: voltage-gated potassium channel [Syntrophus sp. SKADARSKE-3]|nr:voltage-gated potassium channel [Syntrophus sp. SKADARSKE-3]